MLLEVEHLSAGSRRTVKHRLGSPRHIVSSETRVDIEWQAVVTECRDSQFVVARIKRLTYGVQIT